MAKTEAARKAEAKYKEKSIKRVPLDMQKDYYESVLLAAAEKAGMPVNTFIKEAIAEKIARMGLDTKTGG